MPSSPGTEYQIPREQIDDDELLLRTVRADTPLRREAGGRRWIGRCPFHSERSPSFVVFTARDHHGFHCFGCGAHGANAVDYVQARNPALDFRSACAYLGLRPGPRAPLPPPAPADPTPLPKVAPPARDPDVVYPYRDAAGVLRYQVVRWNLSPEEQAIYGKPKLFRHRRPNGRGGWNWTAPPPADELLYRLPELRAALAADPDAPVFVCEGEKDVERALAAGLVATTNSSGAAHWPSHCSPELAGRRVVVVGDHDPAGQARAALVADDLRLAGATCVILDLAAAWPACPTGGDVSDFLAAHHPDALTVLAAYAPALPPIDPTTGEILVQDGAISDQAVEALLAALQAGPAATVADAATLAALADQVAALETEVARLTAALAQYDTLLLGNPKLAPSDRVGLYALQRWLEQHGMPLGTDIEVCQKTLAKQWGVSADTVSRWLDRFQKMEIAEHRTDVGQVPVTGRDGRPQGRRYQTRTVLNCAAAPLDHEVTVLVSPAGKKGAQHGGARTATAPCPACGAPPEQQEVVSAIRCGACHHTYTVVDIPDPAENSAPESAENPAPVRESAATPLPLVGSATVGGSSLRAVADAVRAEWAPAAESIEDPDAGPPLEPDAPDYWQPCPRCHQVNPRRWPSGGWLCGCRFDPPIPPPPPDAGARATPVLYEEEEIL